MAKQLESQLADTNNKLEQATRTINDLTSQKSRLQAENGELSRQLEEAESQVNQLSKVKANLSKSLEEAKSSLEEESRMRSKLQGEVRNLQAELDQIREQLEAVVNCSVLLPKPTMRSTCGARSWSLVRVESKLRRWKT